MGKGMLSNLLERKPLDEVAPVVHAPVSGSAEESYKTSDAIWKRDELLLQKMEQKLDREKSTLSTLEYTNQLDAIAHQKMLTESSHKRMVDALTSLERQQYLDSKVWELEQKKQGLEEKRQAISACDAELAEITVLEQSIPFRRVAVAGKRQNLWNEYATLQNDIQRLEKS